MVNIPTVLLRTFVTVVDTGSFTAAARALGVTQPSVSSQIRKLREILGNGLFERSGHRLSLTAQGEIVLTYARRMLSINDLILRVAEPKPTPRSIRMGMPEDFVGRRLTGLLADFRQRWPDLRFSIYPGDLEDQLQELRQGHLDIALGPSMNGSYADARHRWSEEAVWLRGRATTLDPAAPVPLVAFREDWICHRLAVAALSRAGRAHDLVFTAPTITSLAAAIGAGLGVMALSRSRVRLPDVTIWQDAPLPKLPDLSWGIYVREGGERGRLEEIADATAAAVTAAASAP
jgi:DNA-binding transcriptional LysR family regulator